MKPGKKDLQPPFARDEVARWWGSIEDRLEAGPARARAPRRAPALAVAFAAVAAAALAVAGPWRGVRSLISPGVPQVSVALPAGPLTLEGQASPLSELPADRALAAVLSDRSQIASSGPVELRILENSDTRFEVKQAHGRVRYEITPGGPHRWTIDCALASVEIVGTALTIESDPRRLRVRVEHGVVLVRGERVPDRVQRVAAGEELVVTAAEDSAAPPPAASSTAAPALSAPLALSSAPSSPLREPPEAHRPQAPGSSGPAAASPRPWRELASTGAFKEAYSELGAGGVARAAAEASVEELFALADVSRYSGHPQEAVAPLQTIVQRGGGQAALAAFTLGRMRMDQLGDPSAAVVDLERALSLGLAGGLRDDAQVRRVDALARSGQTGRASEEARLLVERSPSMKGRLEKWLPR
jgi:transmembrane sensor